MGKVWDWVKAPLQLGGQAATPAPERGAAFVLDASADALATWFGGMSLLAQPITRAEALQVPAVQRARNIIAGGIGTLPLIGLDAGNRRVTRPLLSQPETVTHRGVTLARTAADLLFESIAWWLVVAEDANGYPLRVQRLDPGVVSVTPPGGLPDQSGFTEVPVPYGEVRVMGAPPPGRLIRFDASTPPLLRDGARAIRTLLKLDQAAANYADSPMPLDVFMPADGADPADDKAIVAMLDDWKAARQARASAYIPAALRREQSVPLTAEQIQLAESRQHAVLEVARLTGIDPEDLGVSTTSRTYQNGQQRFLDLVKLTLGTYLSDIEGRLSMDDVCPPGESTRFDLSEFERADTLSRYQAYEIGLRTRAITEDEMRASEQRPKLPPAPPAPALPANSSGPAGTVTPLRRPAAAAAGADPAHTFAGDVERFDFGAGAVQAFQLGGAGDRTLAGLAVPYGPIAQSRGRRYRFQQGCLFWSEVERVKLLIDHDYSLAIGHAVELDDQPAGLFSRFAVGRSARADEALALAQDKVRDGLSIGVDFEGIDQAVVDDPYNPGVLLVQRARLREITLTAMPSFDDARLTSVTASLESPMHCTACGQQHAPGPCPTAGGAGPSTATMTATPPAPAAPAGTVTLTAEQFAQLLAGQQQHPAAPATPAAAPVPTAEPVPVVPAQGGRLPAGFAVTEAPVYHFGRRGITGASLVRDLFKSRTEQGREADEAAARLGKFRAQQAQLQAAVEVEQETIQMSGPGAAGVEFTTGTRANISQIIPPGYRPEYYVPQLFQGRPMIEAISRGVITDATAFSIPKFGTSTGLSGTGTEGTNPTDGTITAGTITVTPATAVGLFKVTRELVDASNPAIDAIALQAMQEAYSQDVEGRVYAKVNSANGVAGTITSGFVPSGAAVATATGAGAGLSDDGVALIRTLRQQLTAYPFRRFAPVTRGLVSAEGATLLTSAEDTTGRPLLPPVSAMNAAGTMGGNGTPDMGWNLDGLAIRPAWSMTGNAAGDPDSLLFNHNDVWCWESPLLLFRYEERSGPALIELAMFGYFAVEILRALGFSAVRVTAVP